MRCREIRGIQTGTPGAAQPAEHGAATSPDSVRLSEEAAGQLHRPAARRNGATATARTGCVFRRTLVRVGGTPWTRSGLGRHRPQRRRRPPSVLRRNHTAAWLQRQLVRGPFLNRRTPRRNASEKGSAVGDGQPRTIIHFLQRQPRLLTQRPCRERRSRAPGPVVPWRISVPPRPILCTDCLRLHGAGR